MNQYKKLTLFPEKWWEKMTERELAKSRAKLDAYSTSATLETGLREVGKFSIFIYRHGGGRTSFFNAPEGAAQWG